MTQKTYLDKLMENKEFKEKFINELEKDMNACSPDKYGYVESDVYKKVIAKLKAIIE